MYYKNAKIYTQDFRFQAGAFSVENGRFAEDKWDGSRIILLCNTYLSPEYVIYIVFSFNDSA